LIVMTACWSCWRFALAASLNFAVYCLGPGPENWTWVHEHVLAQVSLLLFADAEMLTNVARSLGSGVTVNVTVVC